MKQRESEDAKLTLPTSGIDHTCVHTHAHTHQVQGE